MKNNLKKCKIIFRIILVVVIIGVIISLNNVHIDKIKDYQKQTAVIVVSGGIGVSLLENGNIVSNRDYTDDTWEGNTEGLLLEGLLVEGEEFNIGQRYNEVLSVKNTGTIDQYARVIIYKFWQYEDGTKSTYSNPDLIELGFTDNEWFKDETKSNSESTVLYYPYIIKAGEEIAFMDSFRINPEVNTAFSCEYVNQDNGTVIITSAMYNGVKFVIQAKVDVVQTHNAEDAIKSAWDVDVTIASDGTLSF